MKQGFYQKILTFIPPELEETYTKQLLKNSIFRIRILCITLTIVKLSYAFYWFYSDKIAHITKTLYYESYSLSIITVLFLLFTVIFSKKKNFLLLWFMNYFFIGYYIIFALINMIFIGSDIPILYLFSVTIFVSVFVPDFKPKVFISFGAFFYLSTAEEMKKHCIIGGEIIKKYKRKPRKKNFWIMPMYSPFIIMKNGMDQATNIKSTEQTFHYRQGLWR